MTIAVVVGTFDYFHKGYLTTINKALEVADRVIVAIKKEGVFSQDIRKMEVESARVLHGTEGLVQQLRDFRLNINNMTVKEAQRSLDKISVDMSRFL